MVIFFSTQTLGDLKFSAGGRRCFLGSKYDEESARQTGGQTGRQTLFHITLQYFFQKAVTVTTLLLFGPVTLHCRTFLFI